MKNQKRNFSLALVGILGDAFGLGIVVCCDANPNRLRRDLGKRCRNGDRRCRQTHTWRFGDCQDRQHERFPVL